LRFQDLEITDVISVWLPEVTNGLTS
jgi:hypothetical protein